MAMTNWRMDGSIGGQSASSGRPFQKNILAFLCDNSCDGFPDPTAYLRVLVRQFPGWLSGPYGTVFVGVQMSVRKPNMSAGPLSFAGVVFRSRIGPTMGLAICVLITGCKSSTCTGQVLCERLVGECEQIDGCISASACEYMGTPPSPCKWQSEQSCGASPICLWNGTFCVDYCTQFSDQASCDGTPILAGDTLHECHWYMCTGTPKKQCSDYSADSCPLDRCSVNSTCATGDCTN